MLLKFSTPPQLAPKRVMNLAHFNYFFYLYCLEQEAEGSSCINCTGAECTHSGEERTTSGEGRTTSEVEGTISERTSGEG